MPAEPDDMLEPDELWSFVLKKSEKYWLWTAMCRRNSQIVAFVIGDRSEKTCRRLWNQIPAAYKCCRTFSDFWEIYRKVFPRETHRCVDRKRGETAHMERWYSTLRQRLARLVRKTLSFSKTDVYHHMSSTGSLRSTVWLCHHLPCNHYQNKKMHDEQLIRCLLFVSYMKYPGVTLPSYALMSLYPADGVNGIRC